jgi:hypothetical protein
MSSVVRLNRQVRRLRCFEKSHVTQARLEVERHQAQRLAARAANKKEHDHVQR